MARTGSSAWTLVGLKIAIDRSPRKTYRRALFQPYNWDSSTIVSFHTPGKTFYGPDVLPGI
jgi:hypothetical protein